MKTFQIPCIFIAFFILGCSKTQEPLPTASESEVNALRQKISTLEEQVSEDKSAIEKFNLNSEKMSNAETVLQIKLLAQEYSTKALQDKMDAVPLLIEPSAVLTIDHPREYAVTRNSMGSFPVFVDSAQPYSDGYKLTLEIANPLMAEITGNITVVSGTAEPPAPMLATDTPEQNSEEKAKTVKLSEDFNKKISVWSASLKHTTVPLPSRLEPGTWSAVEVVVTPAKASELGYIEVTLGVTNFAFPTPQNPQSIPLNGALAQPSSPTTSGISSKEDLDAWIGKSYNELVAVKGNPIRKTPSPDGDGYILTYEETLVMSIPPIAPLDSVIIAQPPPEKEVYKRTVTYTISATGIITGYKALAANRTE